MSAFVTGLKSLFGGSSSSAASDQQQLAQIAQQRTAEATQAASDTSNQALASLGTAPRGQRLLISTADKGLATTLGSST